MRAAPLEEVLAASAAAAPPAEAASVGEGLEVEVPAWARPYARREARPRPPAPPEAAARAAAAAGGAEVLVAHEHTIRGIDLPHLDLVLVTMLPDSPESYMHMAGRTGRAGKAGAAVCIFTEREREEAGVLSRSLGVRWSMTRWSSEGGLEPQRGGSRGPPADDGNDCAGAGGRRGSGTSFESFSYS